MSVSKEAYEEALIKARELLKKKPEGYSNEGYDLQRCIEVIEEYEEAEKNFRIQLVIWKHNNL